ncbi:citramalate synthase [Taurinivorans muris]|uniref:Citramalate synthase n=1 Tax=Taurinivorans muris TaxID=2787751 RepID=A0ABY5XZM8_9BACT|nr:citramalate synthase [Desulfovibrionaceae bacterium LT0009]
MMDFYIYDTSLRDGAQSEDVQLSMPDKIKIALRLDNFGIQCIEGGWPGANPVDNDFFAEIKQYSLKNAKISAFGSTHHASFRAEDDPTMKALVASRMPIMTIFGKSSEKHALDALRVSPAQNLELIHNSIAFLTRHAEKVFFDAEHFFDGFKANKDYALEVLKNAHKAGADTLVLCDSNGGTLPSEVSQIVRICKKELPEAAFGIHAHNDCELAVANSLAALEAGATHIQGTMNGVGERCGNANLCSIIPIIEVKLGKKCLPGDMLRQITATSAYVYEVMNMKPFARQAFVGKSAFAHKGGVHVSAINRDASLYEHIKPEEVGNSQRVLITELAGRSNIVSLARRFGFHLDKDEPVVKGLFHELKTKASLGYDYAAAEASMELLLLRKLARRGVRNFFTLKSLRVFETKDEAGQPLAEATVAVEVEGVVEHTAATGQGPVNAMDIALRKALSSFYPKISELSLRDFKVRVLTIGQEETSRNHDLFSPENEKIPARNGGTASVVRVLIESADMRGAWVTVGVSYDIIEASWQALADSVTYKLYRDEWQSHNNTDNE